jgi:hypothetical protein
MKIEIINKIGTMVLAQVTVGSKTGLREICSDSTGKMTPAWMESKAQQAWANLPGGSRSDYKRALLAARDEYLAAHP